MFATSDEGSFVPGTRRQPALLTKFPEIFEHSSWSRSGELLSSKQEEIDQIIKNRNTVVDQYKIERAILDEAHFPLQLNSSEEIACLFQFCEYYDTASEVLIIISPRKNVVRDRDYQWLQRRDFQQTYPLRDMQSVTFVKRCAHISEAAQLMRNIASIALVGLRKTLLLMGLSVYRGKVLHITSGSGISETVALCDNQIPIIDCDELIVEQIRRQYPYFRLKKVPAGENVTKFCRNMNPREVSNLFHTVRALLRGKASEGYVVLSSSLRIIEIADYVLVQQNQALWKDRFAVDKDVEAAQVHGKVVHMIDGYASDVLSCTTDQI